MTGSYHTALAFRTLAGAVLLVGVWVGRLSAQEVPVAGLSSEHEGMGSYVGDWAVYRGSFSEELSEEEPIGSAKARTRLSGRFLEIEVDLASGPFAHALYTLGFDTRHGEYQVVLMDDSGTYFVTARGEAEGPRIKMYGKDDDPVMASMGLEKEFVVEFLFSAPDRMSIAILFVDTRTPDRPEIPFLKLELRRH